jgi:hypothetical protein
VGDAAVAGRMLGGGKLGALHSSSTGIMMINARIEEPRLVVAILYGTAWGNAVTERPQSRRICHRDGQSQRKHELLAQARTLAPHSS